MGFPIVFPCVPHLTRRCECVVHGYSIKPYFLVKCCAHYPPGMLVYLVCPSDSLRSWLFLHPMWRTANHRPMTEEVTLPWLPVLCVPCLTHSAPEHLLPEGRLVYPPLAHSKRPGDSYTEMLNKCLIELRSSTYLKCPPPPLIFFFSSWYCMRHSTHIGGK
jgi:hypothetical protein